MGDPASSHFVAPGHCRSGGVEDAATSGGLNRDFYRFCSSFVWPAWQPADPLRRDLLDAAQKAPQRGCCSLVGYGTSEVAVPYIDINPHRSRPKWWGYLALGVLLVVTVAVVTAALTHG
jgi:hypothetical protein